MDNELNVLSSRAGFNTALRHFKNVTGYVSEIGGGANLADLINESLDDGVIKRFQVKTIINALLVDKLTYIYKSHNIEESIEAVEHIVDSIAEWGNVQLIIAYFNPQAGQYVINPKNKAHWEGVLPLIRDELAVIYAGSVENELKPDIMHAAIDDFISVLYGGGRNLSSPNHLQRLRLGLELHPGDVLPHAIRSRLRMSFFTTEMWRPGKR
jgi:hypothetical protein